jgi:hypothetical protein
VNSHKIAKNTATTEAREKIRIDLESVEFLQIFKMCLTKFENYQILMNEIRRRYLATTNERGFQKDLQYKVNFTQDKPFPIVILQSLCHT